jgi:hypothetical protein
MVTINSHIERAAGLIAIVALAIVVVASAPSVAMAAGDTELTVTDVSSYVTADGQRFIDGVVRNDSFGAVRDISVVVGWEENEARTDVAVVSDPALASGSWTTFSLQVSADVSADWNPRLTAMGTGSPYDGIELRVGSVSAIPAIVDGYRYYAVDVTNDSLATLDSITLSGIERHLNPLVDAVVVDDAPERLVAGATARIVFHGTNESLDPSATEVRASGRQTAHLSILALDSSPEVGSQAVLSAVLRDADGAAIAGDHRFHFLRSFDGIEWTCVMHGAATQARLDIDRPTLYQVALYDDTELGTTVSQSILVTPSAKKIVAIAPSPSWAPVPTLLTSRVRVRRSFSLHGAIAGSDAQSVPAQLLFYRQQGRRGRWVLKATVSVSREASGAYGATTVLRQRGDWRVRASLPSGLSTPYRYFRVR